MHRSRIIRKCLISQIPGIYWTIFRYRVIVKIDIYRSTSWNELWKKIHLRQRVNRKMNRILHRRTASVIHCHNKRRIIRSKNCRRIRIDLIIVPTVQIRTSVSSPLSQKSRYCCLHKKLHLRQQVHSMEDIQAMWSPVVQPDIDMHLWP